MKAAVLPRVLLLADEGPMTQLLGEWIGECEMQPTIAHNPTGAIDLLRLSKFDCVVIEMSRTFELLDCIQSVRSSGDESVGIVATSSYCLESEFRDRIAGMDVELLVAPFRLQATTDAIARAIGKSRKLRSTLAEAQMPNLDTRSIG